jgi:3-methyladenine DNA glycosylase/8-oxoguanine DNA glycosylase
MSDSGEFFREAGIIVGEAAEEASMSPAPEICERARLARDPRFDGRFLERRALPGLEEVRRLEYRRRVGSGETWITVSQRAGGLMLKVPAGTSASLSSILRRVGRLFDLQADSAVIDAHLSRDPGLASLVAALPGLRVPGAWDGFEMAVRAMLGQQVSVERARRLAETLIHRCREGEFPEPRVLARFVPATVGIPGERRLAIA